MVPASGWLEAEAQRRAIQVGDASTARGATTHSSCVRKRSCEYGSRSPCRRSQLPGLEVVATLQSMYPAVTAMACTCRCMYCTSMLRHQISHQCLRYHHSASERGRGVALITHLHTREARHYTIRAHAHGSGRRVVRCVAVCCSVLQCVTVCCCVLQCVRVSCRMLP